MGIKIIEQRMLLACENGIPITIDNRGCWIKRDMDNLHDIFADLEADTD